MADELIEFLRARLDEWEQVSRRNLGDAGVTDQGTYPDVATFIGEDMDAADEYLLAFRPPIMLADIESKRRIIEEHPVAVNGLGEHFCRTCADGTNDGDLEGEWPCRTLLLLALPYDTHPDYREEWRPRATRRDRPL